MTHPTASRGRFVRYSPRAGRPGSAYKAVNRGPSHATHKRKSTHDDDGESCAGQQVKDHPVRYLMILVGPGRSPPTSLALMRMLPTDLTVYLYPSGTTICYTMAFGRWTVTCRYRKAERSPGLPWSSAACCCCARMTLLSSSSTVKAMRPSMAAQGSHAARERLMAPRRPIAGMSEATMAGPRPLPRSSVTMNTLNTLPRVCDVLAFITSARTCQREEQSRW